MPIDCRRRCRHCALFLSTRQDARNSATQFGQLDQGEQFRSTPLDRGMFRRPDIATRVVPEGHVLMLDDARGNSLDGR
jgi:hypothetical protein